MLRHVHQLVANFICQPFGAGQWVISSFVTMKILACAALM